MLFRTSWLGLLVGVGLLLLPRPAQAWQDYDSLRLCNTNKEHDVQVAYAAKGVPWGIAALLAEGWHREGWFTVKAGRCEHTMALSDVDYYEIWLFVQVVGGEQIHWQSSTNREFCVHPVEAFDERAWSLSDIQRCREGEQSQTFSYMGKVFNVADAYSIYSTENRTIELDFTYGTRASRPTASSPARSQPEIAPAPALESQPRQSKLVQICTRNLVDGGGRFLPVAYAAIMNGAMDEHYAQIDIIVDAMKRNPDSPLNRILAGYNDHVQLIVSPYDQSQKHVEVLAASSPTVLRCADDYRSAIYDAKPWLQGAGLSPRGLAARQ